MIYGKQVKSKIEPGTSVVGEVSKTAVGNTILRAGHTNADGSWSQTEYIVLTPDEIDALIIDMLHHGVD